MHDILHAGCRLVIEARRRSSYSIPALHVARVTAKKPATGPNEVAIRLELELPAGLFTRPTLTAKVAIEGDAVPKEITAEALAGVEDCIRAAGFDVRVVAQEQEQQP